jgi:hypothetical protein
MFKMLLVRQLKNPSQLINKVTPVQPTVSALSRYPFLRGTITNVFSFKGHEVATAYYSPETGHIDLIAVRPPFNDKKEEIEDWILDKIIGELSPDVKNIWFYMDPCYSIDRILSLKRKHGNSWSCQDNYKFTLKLKR